MNAFTNDGSFMEQFLKRQKLSSGETEEDQQNQQQGGYDQNAYYGQQQQGGYDNQYYGGGGNQMPPPPPGGDDQWNQQYGGQQMGGYMNNNNMGGYGNQMPPHQGGKGGPMDPTKIVWAGNVHPDSTEDEIRSLFSQFGFIQAIKIIPNKQCAFITFADINCAIQAQYNLNGTPIRGFPLKLGFGKVENAPQQNFDGGMRSDRGGFRGGDDRGSGGGDRGGFMKQEEIPSKNLWLGNVSPNVTSDLLKQVFEPFGNVDTIRILVGRGCAFVNFFTPEAAINARNGLNGTMVCGMPLKINFRKEDESRFRGGDDRGGFRGGGDRGGDFRGGNNEFGGGDNNRDSGPPQREFGGDRRPPRPGFREHRENQIPLPAPPPQSPQEQQIIDKFAEYVAKTGPRLEAFTAEKQKNNHFFSFLKPRSPSNDYYKWKLWTIRNPDTHSSDTTNNNNTNTTSPNQLQQQQQQQPNQQQQEDQSQQQQPNHQQQQQQQNYPTTYLDENEVREFKEILEKLTPSKPSVTQCKNWIMSHTRNSLEIISIIVVNFQTLQLSFAQKLNVLHVLNDCLHFSVTKRQTPDDWKSDEFASSIKDYLPFIIGITSSGESPENQDKVLKVLLIWENQKFYPKDFIDTLRNDATDNE